MNLDRGKKLHNRADHDITRNIKIVKRIINITDIWSFLKPMSQEEIAQRKIKNSKQRLLKRIDN
jgi:hypothetical protein